jgi:Protein of unknown function VcgC/VcgE (DUF2780)
MAFQKQLRGTQAMKLLTILLTITVVMAIIGCATAPQNVAQTSSVGLPPTDVASAAASMAGSATGATPAVAQAPGLVNILVQQLGITPTQAAGGAGSIFSMAQQSMAPSNFGLVSKAVPGMEQLLAAAPATGATNLMGGAAGSLGGLGNLAALASSFQNLGMGSGMMNQFIPIILQYVQSQGGFSTMSLLQGVLLP